MINAIAVVRSGTPASTEHAKALHQPGHALDLGQLSPEGELPAGVVSAPAIEAASPAEFSDRILRALFGKWPPRA